MMRRLVALGVALLATVSLHAQGRAAVDATGRARECASCAEWNAAQKPFRLFGNAWFVGTHGLSAVLITSASGHVLLDGGLPESASHIAANIATLGFRIGDVKLIVNSHDHFDHAGGIAELQKLSGARVAASGPSARVLRLGDSERDDPQFGLTLKFPKVATVETIKDGETLQAGDIRLTARFTPGHTPGGTSWSWQSCENNRCVDMVYADSQTPVSADDFFFSRSRTYPNAVIDFEKGFAALESIRCDILITPHPDASQLWQRVAARDAGQPDALIDASACKRYAAAARQRLAARLATEAKKPL